MLSSLQVMRLGEETDEEDVGIERKSGLVGEGARSLETMSELRGRVLRCWALLQSSSGFDPQALMPLVEVRPQIHGAT